MTNAVAKVERTQAMVDPSASAAPAASPMAGALAFLQAGGDAAQLERMMAMQRQWEADEARKAFVADMAAFKKNPPEILKDKHVQFQTAKGTTAYEHATIGEVCDKIISAAAEHGFSHRWVPSRGDNGQLIVTCVITHRLGHSEETRLEGPRDDSGGKNAIQAIVSTNTYLQRHSLLMAFGFATKDQPDDDGRAAGVPVDSAALDWIATAQALTNLGDYHDKKAELVKAYGDPAVVPKNVVAAFNAAFASLKGAK